ncbi:two-component sensor histidine kinase [Parabacteroides goldsteinii]|uniref:sensor histidine kinase n=1 Tax=Parabacteroides goldsteinii TaxID=328812 RepID=UPI001CCEFA0B|nr:ATP-binding protein [Parabacteroides goldsteinii]UBD76086.1 two-component sensor histidine kinase [Parabacteroides goldsteinii]
MVRVEKMKNRIPFSQRLFWSIFVMFLGFTVCFLLFQYQREREFSQEKLNNVLSNYNYQLFSRTQQDTDINKTVRQFIEDIPQKELRVTIIDPNGKVLFDNSGTEEFNNHNDRSEVRKARLYNEGFAIRTSGSTGRRYFYSASNIGSYIYRSALPYDPYVQSALSMDKDFIYFMILMTLIFFFVLSRFTFSIGRTISKLRDFALNIEKDRIPENDYIFPNDELGDISKNIVTLYHRQQKAKDELSMEREKLIKHFQYAKEGFAMFTAEGKEILSNILFIQFLNVISDNQIRQAEDAQDIRELEPIKAFLNKNIPNMNRKRKVLRESVTIDKNGKIFLIECILFLDNSYEISINDISRQEEESRMKRQLTQNVAHELKTPVSSIQGYLETIISNPELTPDKRQFFLERCYSQSTRLTGLLRDISVLNRLDEASEMFDLSDINIPKLIVEIQKECSKEMDEKQITSEVILPGDPTIHGNYSLLYSIFRNLYDNAIAYAGEGSQITVNCYKEDPKFYYFSFADNGVGISEEHINRIFERFYRVDKGRSRKVGGTGLGLSIVKNGVNFHKGQISAKSSPGKGVTFFFTLKKKL